RGDVGVRPDFQAAMAAAGQLLRGPGIAKGARTLQDADDQDTVDVGDAAGNAGDAVDVLGVVLVAGGADIEGVGDREGATGLLEVALGATAVRQVTAAGTDIDG